mmetsp:Transcript_31577/g.23422  ORF Transcript_31577/g.23422 Transcript_31577/m.23422 type:complete len:87 (+) Transcript_31577:404-664(+)
MSFFKVQMLNVFNPASSIFFPVILLEFLKAVEKDMNAVVANCVNAQLEIAVVAGFHLSEDFFLGKERKTSVVWAIAEVLKHVGRVR